MIQKCCSAYNALSLIHKCLAEWFFQVFVLLVKKYLSDKNLSQKAILLLDNASCHLKEDDLKTADGDIYAVFLPPNTTALLQPLDQNIMKILKYSYRKKLLVELLMIKEGNVSGKLKICIT